MAQRLAMESGKVSSKEAAPNREGGEGLDCFRHCGKPAFRKAWQRTRLPGGGNNADCRRLQGTVPRLGLYRLVDQAQFLRAAGGETAFPKGFGDIVWAFLWRSIKDIVRRKTDTECPKDLIRRMRFHTGPGRQRLCGRDAMGGIQALNVLQKHAFQLYHSAAFVCGVQPTYDSPFPLYGPYCTAKKGSSQV